MIYSNNQSCIQIMMNRECQSTVLSPFRLTLVEVVVQPGWRLSLVEVKIYHFNK